MTARHPTENALDTKQNTLEGLVPSTCNACFFSAFSEKFANKIIRFNTPYCCRILLFLHLLNTEMNPSVNEICRRQKPDAFKQEVDWFAKRFYQPKTRLEISASTIDAFQSMIWDKPGDEMLPTYGKYFCCHFSHL